MWCITSPAKISVMVSGESTSNFSVLLLLFSEIQEVRKIIKRKKIAPLPPRGGLKLLKNFKIDT
jgi:hypothetical protein